MNKKAVQKPRILNPSQNSVAENKTTQVMEMGGRFEVEVGMGVREMKGREGCELATSRHENNLWKLNNFKLIFLKMLFKWEF